MKQFLNVPGQGFLNCHGDLRFSRNGLGNPLLRVIGSAVAVNLFLK